MRRRTLPRLALSLLALSRLVVGDPSLDASLLDPQLRYPLRRPRRRHARVAPQRRRPVRPARRRRAVRPLPSSYKDVATTQNDHQIHFPEPSCCLNGKGVWHEYGHVLHMRAWNGTTGPCGDCPGGDYMRDDDPSWGATEREYPNTAFAEGWANYVRRVTSTDDTDNCAAIDDNADSWACNADSDEYPDTNDRVTYPNDGESYARNVTKLLCDWHDDGAYNDDDPYLAGGGDHFTASLWSVWYNLDEMWDWAADTDGLQVCDYIDYYVNGRKSAANVGATTHDAYVALISELAYNNALKCGMPHPDDL